MSVLADIELPELPHYLAIAPNSHAGGTMLLPAWRRGGTVHTVSKFEPDGVFNAIERERINITFLMLTMLYALLDQLELARYDIGSLQCIYYGAAPASPQRLQEAIDRLGPILSQGYGQTECYPISVLRRHRYDRSCQPDWRKIGSSADRAACLSLITSQLVKKMLTRSFDDGSS